MHSITGRHMFWQAPAQGGTLRTIPFRQGGRPVMMGSGLFMGQAQINRLDQVSIAAIIGRIQIDPIIAQYVASPPMVQQDGSLGMVNTYRPHPPPLPSFPPMSEAEKQILFEVSKNPTDEELKDLATIDDLFSQNFQAQYLTTNEVCYYVKQGYPLKGFGKFAPVLPTTGEEGAEYALVSYFRPKPAPIFSKWGGGKKVTAPDSSFLDDKFWCPDPSTVAPSTFLAYMPDLGRFSSFASMFGIDTNKTWGEAKLPTKNGLIMLKAKVSYPLPPPLDMAVDYTWVNAAGPHLVDLAHVGAQVDPEVFRMWYTMAVLDSYDSISDAIIAEQKRKAKKAKRKAIIKTVAFVIAGIVLSFIVPGIIAAAISAIKAAVDAYIDAKKRAEAAKAMSEAAKMFDADAPAYAAELQKAADMMDAAAAQEEADAPLTQEQLDAIQEVKDNPEPGAAPTTGQALVTTGAAAGIIAAMVAIFHR